MTQSSIPRKHKYRAVRTNGYASKKEANRAVELRILERCHQITDLKEQVRFQLIAKQGKERAVAYVADFTYNEWTGSLWTPVVEDVKGFKTPMYKLKKRLMSALLGIEVRES